MLRLGHSVPLDTPPPTKACNATDEAPEDEEVKLVSAIAPTIASCNCDFLLSVQGASPAERSSSLVVHVDDIHFDGTSASGHHSGSVARTLECSASFTSIPIDPSMGLPLKVTDLPHPTFRVMEA